MAKQITQDDWEFLDLEELELHLARVIVEDSEDDYLYICDLEDHIAMIKEDEEDEDGI